MMCSRLSATHPNRIAYLLSWVFACFLVMWTPAFGQSKKAPGSYHSSPSSARKSSLPRSVPKDGVNQVVGKNASASQRDLNRLEHTSASNIRSGQPRTASPGRTKPISSSANRHSAPINFSHQQPTSSKSAGAKSGNGRRPAK